MAYSGNYAFCFVVVILAISFINCDDKWTWSKDRSRSVTIIRPDAPKVTVAKPILANSSRRYSKIEDEPLTLEDNEDLRKARYEVQELTSYNRVQPYNILTIKRQQMQRPLTNRSPLQPSPLLDHPSSTIRSDYNLQTNLQTAGSEQPPLVRQPPLDRQPPPPDVGILTGPVPSWERPILHKNGDPTNFEHCKCSFSFNCKSPGIQFGNCDQGKTYCCYNDFGTDKRRPSSDPNGYGSSNIDRYDRPIPPPSILTGPEGSVGISTPRSSLPPALLPRGNGYDYPYKSTYEDNIDDELDQTQREYNNRQPYPIIPQKPVLPPYMGLHNDYRSS